jgi:hypothetical protein
MSGTFGMMSDPRHRGVTANYEAGRIIGREAL